jgi:hypothetical protein
MNTNIFKLFIFSLVCILFSSCAKTPLLPDYEGNASITLTTLGRYNFSFIISGSGPFSIDWGDGIVEKGKLESWDDLLVYHNYRNGDDHSIIIRGDVTYLRLIGEIKNLDASNNTIIQAIGFYVPWFGDRYEYNINVSNATALKTLYHFKSPSRVGTLDASGCNSLQTLDISNPPPNAGLTSLDLSGLNSLVTVNISGNRLQAPALNSLFETLHTQNTGNKIIDVRGNPGFSDANRTIATSRGWTVVGW